MILIAVNRKSACRTCSKYHHMEVSLRQNIQSEEILLIHILSPIGFLCRRLHFFFGIDYHIVMLVMNTNYVSVVQCEDYRNEVAQRQNSTANLLTRRWTRIVLPRSSSI